MGSSRVKILYLLFSLNFSIKFASVVDFPLPVTPVTKTKPFFKFKIFSSMSLFIKLPFNLGSS